MVLAPSSLNTHYLGSAMMMSQQGHPAWIWTCVPCTDRIGGESGEPLRTPSPGASMGAWVMDVLSWDLPGTSQCKTGHKLKSRQGL